MQYRFDSFPELQLLFAYRNQLLRRELWLAKALAGAVSLKRTGLSIC